MAFTSSRFIITENAYYFKIKKAISKTRIEQIIQTASSTKRGPYPYKVVREVHSYVGHSFILSAAVFRYESLPSFLTKGPEIEIKYGYIVLIEHNNYLVISKRATSDFVSLLEGYVDEIDYNTLSKYKITPSTQYKKLGVSSLDTSRRTMRRAIYEAEDIQGVLSTISTGSKVVSSFKIKNLNGQSSIALGTSRINDLGNKVNIKDFCLWIAGQCNQINSFKPIQTYLDNFAEPIDYNKSISSLTPISILLNFTRFLDDLETGLINRIIYQYGTMEREIQLNVIVDNHDLCMDVLYNSSTKSYEIENNLDSSLVLIIGKSSIHIDSSKLKHIYIEYISGELINLQNAINKDSLFIVSFQNIDVRYTFRTLFRDNKLLGNINYFLKSIQSSPHLAVALSEKGHLKKSSTSFDATSLFGIIETSISTDQYLWCDDLGDEWADYIGFTDKKSITFYHAKASNKRYSASAFHDLVSQAVKNIGNFDFNKDLSSKKTKISNLYSGSRIKRLRRGKATTCFRALKETYNSPNITREIVLVINFLNKKQLETELKNLKKGKAKNQTVQILWLLSTLIGTCQERGINVRIITS